MRFRYDGNWGTRDKKSGRLEEVDSRHRTALHLALERFEKSAEEDDSDSEGEGEGEGGSDPAVDASGLDLIRVLLRHKADVNARDANERTPLQQAVDAGKHGIAKMLLEAN